MAPVLKGRRLAGAAADEALLAEGPADPDGKGGGQGFQTGYVHAAEKSVRYKEAI